MFIKTYAVKLLMVLQLLLVYAVSSAVSNSLIERTGRIGILVLIIIFIYDYRKKQTKNIILPDKIFNISYWAFFLLILLSSYLVGYQDSFHTAYSYSKLAVFTFLVFYFLFQKIFPEHILMGGIVGGILTICVYSFEQFFALPLGSRIAGKLFTDHPNLTAMILIPSIPFLIVYIANKEKDKIWRSFLIITTAIVCFVLAITGSRGGIIGFCLGALIFLLAQTLYVQKWSRKKLIRNYVVVTVSFLCIFGTYFAVFHHHDTPRSQVGVTRSYDSQRILFWKSSYHMWEDHKLLGVGLEHWKAEYYSHYILPQATEKNISFPHNTFFSYFSMTGLIGGIGYLFFTFGIFIYLCRKLKSNPNDIYLNAILWSFSALMIHGMFDTGIMDHYPMLLCNAYLGIGLASVAYHERITKQSQ